MLISKNKINFVLCTECRFLSERLAYGIPTGQTFIIFLLFY